MGQYEKSHRWAVCPSCKEEWSKLKPCQFIWDGKWTEDNLCVQCAETIKGIRNLLERYPIEGVDLHTGFNGPMVAKTTIYGKEHRETLWRNGWATLSLGNLKVALASTNAGVVVVVGEEDPKFHDNMLAALSIARKAFDQFCDPKNLDSVGKKSYYR